MAVIQKAFLALAVLLLASMLFSGCGKKESDAGREVAALVNGQKIYVDEINSDYNSLTPAQREITAKSDALGFFIEREVLYQEALRQKLKVTSHEVDDELDFYLQVNNRSSSQLKAMLEGANSSIGRFKDALRKQVLINKLFERAIPRNFVIKQNEVRSVYNAGGFATLNITFEKAEKSIVELLTAQRQDAERKTLIARLKEEADVVIVGVV